ncbi:toll/interleukin-1 receptor domain-containing protein [Taibaiella chishuiensis]|uniref:SEFIR domain-containing protein n=1 Tax=Taibaiella chishuiensis TaxID=1434707 RepID=A0A2P8D0S1_9BACT|nr:toll/interleukin-1 receptor domain-containing protein [Taibaiella chishuiensis]PSK90821.1 SEFIR domain-containing protein [Taibaiella chishuiensis]
MKNEFYNISDGGENSRNSFQLTNLGEKIVFMTLGTSKRSGWGERTSQMKDYYRDTTERDYDDQFASRISSTDPPYEVDSFLDFHYNYYCKTFPEKHKIFLKHLKYVIIPLLEKRNKTVYIDLINEWLDEKNIIMPKPMTLTTAEKLDKVLIYLVANQEKHNITPNAIQEYIFNKEITLEEAKHLHSKILSSGNVRVVGNRYLAYSTETDLFLSRGGFSGDSKEAYRTESATKSTTEINIFTQKESMSKVFISYRWDTPEHEKKVVEFTEHLRKSGIDAEIDKMLSQKETATNFGAMMHKAMMYPKVIVVLSKGYKTSADTFNGGVGTEYQLIINDINKQGKKYILVSFDGRPDEIIPFGFIGRDIIDLSKPDGEEKLFRKLLDQDEYVFSEVSPDKPSFEPVQIGEFMAVSPESIIKIEVPSIKKGNTSSIAGVYKSIEFTLRPTFRNASGKTIDGFAYSLKIKTEMAPEHYSQPIEDGYFVFNEEVSKKIYPNLIINGNSVNVKITGQSIYRILGTAVTITVFTDHGNYAKEFMVDELFKVPSSPSSYGDAIPLNKDMFAGSW